LCVTFHGRIQSGDIRPTARLAGQKAAPELADREASDVGVRPRDAPTHAIAHRQVVPQSAETLATVTATRGTWTQTERTPRHSWAAAARPARAPRLAPASSSSTDTIKRLPAGTAAVTSPGHTEARIARMHHPTDAR
jgi:hypothetical protein